MRSALLTNHQIVSWNYVKLAVIYFLASKLSYTKKCFERICRKKPINIWRGNWSSDFFPLAEDAKRKDITTDGNASILTLNPGQSDDKYKVSTHVLMISAQLERAWVFKLKEIDTLEINF